jgi:hypothetical protein
MENICHYCDEGYHEDELTSKHAVGRSLRDCPYIYVSASLYKAKKQYLFALKKAVFLHPCGNNNEPGLWYEYGAGPDNRHGHIAGMFFQLHPKRFQRLISYFIN